MENDVHAERCETSNISWTLTGLSWLTVMLSCGGK